MPKPTTGHRVLAIETLQSIMADWFEHAVEIGAAPETIEAMRIEYRQLETRKQRLLQPKPRKPKTEVTGSTEAMNPQPIKRWGRDGR